MERWVAFKPIPNPGKRTKRWSVVSVVDQTCVGEISWWSHWRRYVFRPNPSPIVYGSSIFDATCLYSIGNFCEEKTDEQKKTWKRGRKG